MKKPKAQVITMQPLQVGSVQPSLNTPLKPDKKRVFSDAEWSMLQKLPTDVLLAKIERGRDLIQILHRPEMLNIKQGEADMLSSNLQYQIEAIQSIINKRSSHGAR